MGVALLGGLLLVALQVVFLLSRKTVPAAKGQIIASFRADFQPEQPKKGWRYLWNESGPLGDASKYAELQHARIERPAGKEDYYVMDASSPFPGRSPAPYLRVSAAGGHPGHGPFQTKTDHEHFVIYAFSIPARGRHWLTNTFLARGAGKKNGAVHVQVFVNDIEAGHDISCRTRDGVSFDRALGNLSAGDIVYVAVGPGDVDAEDGFEIDFSIIR
jgi:hypothetical protein